MTKAMRNHLSGKSGFTLIELMIVIAIIAILAAVAIPQFMSARDRAKRTGASQSTGAFRKAMEMYMADNDTYPVELNTDKMTVPSAELANSLGKYTNVTQLMEAFKSKEVGFAVTDNLYTTNVHAADRGSGSATTCNANGSPALAGSNSSTCVYGTTDTIIVVSP